MRYLEFTQFNKDMYEMLYEGMLASPINLNDRGLKRLHAKVLDKLEAIGERKAKPEELLYTFSGDKGIVEFENAEYDHMKRALDAVSWKPLVVRRGIALEDFIDNADKEKKVG